MPNSPTKIYSETEFENDKHSSFTTSNIRLSHNNDVSIWPDDVFLKHKVISNIISNKVIFENFLEVFSSNLSDLEIVKKQDLASQKEYSEYAITSEGLLNERWDSTVTIPCMIIEITESTILLDCIVDIEEDTIEVRRFKKSLFGKDCRLTINGIILLKVYEKPGKITYELKDGTNLGFEKYFQDKSDDEYLTIGVGKEIK